jgi:hypothetical protein
LTLNCANFPTEATAGLNFTASVDYAADFTLAAILRGPAAINLVATVDGTTHTFTVAAADTANWAPGLYAFSVRATKDADVVELASGQLTILQDLAAVTAGHDPRTDNEKALSAIEAVLANKASQDQMRYRINNRELWRMAVADMLKLQAFYRTRVRRERNRKNGGSFGRTIPVNFQ